jgi:hypothetical protein
MEGIRRQRRFLMERWTLDCYYLGGKAMDSTVLYLLCSATGWAPKACFQTEFY